MDWGLISTVNRWGTELRSMILSAVVWVEDQVLYVTSRFLYRRVRCKVTTVVHDRASLGMEGDVINISFYSPEPCLAPFHPLLTEHVSCTLPSQSHSGWIAMPCSVYLGLGSQSTWCLEAVSILSILL